MKWEPLIKGASYLENVVKPPTKLMIVNPHSKSFSVEAKKRVASRSRTVTFNPRKMKLLEPSIFWWRLECRQMEVTPGTDRIHEEVRSLLIFSFLSRQCSHALSGHHRGKKSAGLLATSKRIMHFG